MAFCINCGHEVSEKMKFCRNCGTPITTNFEDESVSENVNSQMQVSADYEPHMVKDIPTKESIQAKPTWFSRLSKLFGIFLLILAIVDFNSDPPALTVALAIFIIVAAIICFVKRYKLKGFTIIALLLAIVCLLAGIGQGKSLGFFTIPPKEASTSNSTNIKSSTTKDNSGTNATTKKSTSGETKKSTPNGVDPTLKAFLDSYEDFVDEYVEFMKKYMADPGNVVSMLNEYSDIMKKYEDFASKIDEYESKEMSTADEKYYIEVTSRCTQKMLDIY